MKKIHAKSPCCGAREIHYSKRRRQCVRCRKTRTIRPRRRGRKRRRGDEQYLKKVFADRYRVRQLPRRQGTTLAAVAKRFQRVLERTPYRPRWFRLSAGATYVLVIDAQWRSFRKERWTLYHVALKRRDQNEAVFFNPVLLPGKESAARWRLILTDLFPDEHRKKRVVAVISDGLRGLKAVIESFGWKQQRCHFHLLAELAKRLGRRKHLRGYWLRERIFQTVKHLLATNVPRQVNRLRHRLERQARRIECPKKMRMIVNQFIRDLPAFHLYLEHPEWQLPTTTGVLESLNSRMSEIAGRIRTPAALLRWARASVKARPKFVCKGTNYQQN